MRPRRTLTARIVNAPVGTCSCVPANDLFTMSGNCPLQAREVAVTVRLASMTLPDPRQLVADLGGRLVGTVSAAASMLVIG